MPTTRRQTKILRWQRLRLPPEVLDTILADIMDEAIHDAFYCASNFGVHMHHLPSQWLQMATKSFEKHERDTRIRLTEEFKSLTAFRPVLRLAQTCHQYRSVVEAILIRMCPKELPHLDLEDIIFDPDLKQELCHVYMQYQDPHSLLKSLCTLQSLAICATEVGLRYAHTGQISVMEDLYFSLTKLEAVKESPFAWLYLLHSRLKITLHDQISEDWLAGDENPFKETLLEAALRTPRMTPYQRRFLFRVVNEAQLMYHQFRNVISAQYAVDMLRGIARFLLLSGHPALAGESPNFHEEARNIVHLKVIYDAGVEASCFFRQGIGQGVDYSDRSQRLDEEISEALEGIIDDVESQAADLMDIKWLASFRSAEIPLSDFGNLLLSEALKLKDNLINGMIFEEE